MTILLHDRGSKPVAPAASVVPSTSAAWKIIGWFGLLLAVVGLCDLALQWYPLALKSPEWEFGTIANSTGTLPLPTIGLAGILGSFLARGVRRGIVTMAGIFLILGLAVLAAYLLFLLDVPLALNAATGAAALPLKKAIVKTSVMAPGFGIAYIVAAVAAFRHLSREGEGG
jgi:hypothetical protein